MLYAPQVERQLHNHTTSRSSVLIYTAGSYKPTSLLNKTINGKVRAERLSLFPHTAGVQVLGRTLKTCTVCKNNTRIQPSQFQVNHRLSPTLMMTKVTVVSWTRGGQQTLLGGDFVRLVLGMQDNLDNWQFSPIWQCSSQSVWRIVSEGSVLEQSPGLKGSWQRALFSGSSRDSCP